MTPALPTSVIPPRASVSLSLTPGGWSTRHQSQEAEGASWRPAGWRGLGPQPCTRGEIRPCVGSMPPPPPPACFRGQGSCLSPGQSLQGLGKGPLVFDAFAGRVPALSCRPHREPPRDPAGGPWGPAEPSAPTRPGRWLGPPAVPLGYHGYRAVEGWGEPLLCTAPSSTPEGFAKTSQLRVRRGAGAQPGVQAACTCLGAWW